MCVFDVWQLANLPLETTAGGGEDDDHQLNPVFLSSRVGDALLQDFSSFHESANQWAMVSIMISNLAE